MLKKLIVTNVTCHKCHILSQPKSVRSLLFQGKTLFVRSFVRTNVYSHSDWRKDVYNGRIWKETEKRKLSVESEWFLCEVFNQFILYCAHLIVPLTSSKVGCTSEKQKKIVFFLCFSLGLHYLCLQIVE